MNRYFLRTTFRILFLLILCSGCLKTPEEPDANDTVRGQLYGYIYLENESSHAGTRIYLSDSSKTTSYTDTTGTFCFFDVLPGEYSIAIYHEWFESDTIRNITVSSYDIVLVGASTILAGEAVVHEGTEPSWSPYGTKFVFSRYVSDHSQLFIHNLNNNSEIDLNYKGKSPYWSSTGTFIAYEVENGGISTIEPDGTNATLITSVGMKPIVSPNGSKILFHREENSDSGVYIINSDGTGIMCIDSTGRNPDMAQNNNHIVYERNSEIVMTTLDALNDKLIIGNGQNPTFSPYGEQVAFMDYYYIYIVDYDGNTIETAHYAYPTALQWNSYGNKIIYSTYYNAIFCWELAFDNRFELTSDGNNPVCAPDGWFLLFERDNGIRKFRCD